jgi:hypothetical protein
MDLSIVPLAALKAEIRRREAPEPVGPVGPAGRCARCGAEWYLRGPFSPARFEQQAEQFRERHLDCPLSADGGGI